MATASIEHRYFIAAPASKIYAHLSDPHNYIGLSPLVEQVDHIAYSQDSEGRKVCTYESVEMFRFLGFIRYPNRIRVKTTFTQPDAQMVSDVDSPFGVKVRFTFDFGPGDGGTWVHETVKVTVSALLRGFVVGQARSVQLARAQILKSRMEATT